MPGDESASRHARRCSSRRLPSAQAPERSERASGFQTLAGGVLTYFNDTPLPAAKHLAHACSFYCQKCVAFASHCPASLV